MVMKLKKSLTFFKEDFLKVFSLTAISTLIRMISGLVSVKVVAIIIGPSGIALIGQLNNFATIIMIVASGGINNGVTKYVAELRNSVEDIKRLLSSALKIVIICSVSSGILLIAFSRYLSELIMLSTAYSYVFVIFGFTIFLYAFNGLIASILNGFKEFKLFVYVNIIGSIFGFIFTLVLVWVC
ncbi:MAG: O-antigen translocase, partial [Flavobacterium sp.]